MHSLHEKTAAPVLLKLFISSNTRLSFTLTYIPASLLKFNSNKSTPIYKYKNV